MALSSRREDVILGVAHGITAAAAAEVRDEVFVSVSGF